jgi:glutamate synthase domain-containing protein 3
VVVLGEVGLNAGAGMSGGVLYVLDPPGRLPLRLNSQLVLAERGADDELRALLKQHLRHTGSARAAALLEDWHDAAPQFWRVSPRATEGAAERDALEVAG